MTVENDSADILYGDTLARTESELDRSVRLDWISKEVEEVEQSKHNAGLTVSDIPGDFLPLLEAGMPADERVPRLIEVLGGRWLCNTSNSYGPDELEMIFKLLAWGPAAATASGPSAYIADAITYTWANLIKAAIRLAGRQGWRTQLEQAFQKQLDQKQLPFSEFPDLVALARPNAYSPEDAELVTQGRIHCRSTDPDRTVCGRSVSVIGDASATWQSVPRVKKDNPLELLDEPECGQCRHQMIQTDPNRLIAAYRPLDAGELASRTLARAREEIPREWNADQDELNCRHTPAWVRQKLAASLWRCAISSLLLKQPLDADDDALSATSPLT